MEHGQKLYAAKTVPWPGATPFSPPVCGPNPLRGFGGHARPSSPRWASSFGILPRTRTQNRDKTATEWEPSIETLIPPTVPHLVPLPIPDKHLKAQEQDREYHQQC